MNRFQQNKGFLPEDQLLNEVNRRLIDDSPNKPVDQPSVFKEVRYNIQRTPPKEQKLKRSKDRGSRSKLDRIQRRGLGATPTMHKLEHEMTANEKEARKLEHALMRTQVERDNVSED